MADPVKVKIVYDTDDADKQLQAFTQQVVDSFNQAGQDIQKALSLQGAQDAFASLGGQASNALKGIADDSKRAADATESLLEMGQLNEFRGAIGDLGDAVGLLGGEFLGLSEKGQEAVESVLALTEKGMALGALFGVWGAVIGGAAGALAGLAKGFTDTSEASEKAAKRVEEFTKTLERADALRQLAQGLQEGAEGIKQSYDDLAESIAGTLAPINDFSKTSGKDLKQLKDDQKEMLETQKGLLELKAGGIKALEETLDGMRRASQDHSKSLAEQIRMQIQLDEKENELADEKAKLAANQKTVNEGIATYNALTAEMEKRTTAATSAVEDFNRALSVLGGAALGQLERDAIEADAAFSALIDSVTSEDLENTGDRLITFLEKAAYATRNFVDAQEDIDALPSLAEIIGSDTEGIETTEIILSQLKEIPGVTQEVAEAIQGLGQQFASSLGGLAADSVDVLFERIATGEKVAGALRAAIANFLRETGTQLIADGTKNILIGTGRVLFGDSSGAALAGLGVIEVGAGLGMGGVGAFAQSRLPEQPSEAPASGFSSGNPSLGSNDRPTSAQGGNISVTITDNMFLDGDQRGMAKAGHKLGAAIGASRRDLQLDTGV